MARKQQKYTQAFLAWWKVYPVKAAKAKASQAYAKAIKTIMAAESATQAEAAAWLEQVTTKLANTPKGRSNFCPYPATFLNQQRWEDDPATWQEAEGERSVGSHPKVTDTQLQQELLRTRVVKRRQKLGLPMDEAAIQEDMEQLLRKYSP